METSGSLLTKQPHRHRIRYGLSRTVGRVVQKLYQGGRVRFHHSEVCTGMTHARAV
ncbi:hypothetical protein C5S36_14365 [Candidatus Methanophagaceae archaeon]|nr:hypothetical protein C5S36_14365 [Methanophagales archaeon]